MLILIEGNTDGIRSDAEASAAKEGLADGGDVIGGVGGVEGRELVVGFEAAHREGELDDAAGAQWDADAGGDADGFRLRAFQLAGGGRVGFVVGEVGEKEGFELGFGLVETFFGDGGVEEIDSQIEVVLEGVAADFFDGDADFGEGASGWAGGGESGGFLSSGWGDGDGVEVGGFDFAELIARDDELAGAARAEIFDAAGDDEGDQE